MDPITIGFALAGIGTSIFGALGSASTSKQTAEVSQDISRQEKAQNDQRKQQMELQARRQLLENVRNTQRARAMGVQAAVAQGAQQGTGLPGGQAEATSTGNTNAVSIDQNLQIGRNLFALDDLISGDKMRLASLGADQAMYQGVQAVGGAITKAAPIFGAFGKGFGGGSSAPNDYSGNAWSRNTGGLY